jgi:hypothetical protein
LSVFIDDYLKERLQFFDPWSISALPTLGVLASARCFLSPQESAPFGRESLIGYRQSSIRLALDARGESEIDQAV